MDARGPITNNRASVSHNNRDCHNDDEDYYVKPVIG